jgi:hypothetical protein
VREDYEAREAIRLVKNGIELNQFPSPEDAINYLKHLDF